MLGVLVLSFFFHQSYGYGVRVQAKVDIGDETLAVAFKDLMDKYLQNGQAEIDIIDLMERLQILASTPYPHKMKLVTDGILSPSVLNMRDDKSIDTGKKTIEENKPKNDIKVTENTKLAKEQSETDDFSDDSVEKVVKKKIKSKKRLVKVQSDDLSNESKENDRKRTKSKKRHVKHVSEESTDDSSEDMAIKTSHLKKTIKESESSDFSDDSEDYKNTNSKKIRKNDSKSSGKIRTRLAQKAQRNSSGSKNLNAHKTNKESKDKEVGKTNTTKTENKDTKKENTTKKESIQEDIISSSELKELRENLHIYGSHKGINDGISNKYPMNNIRA